MSNPESEPVGGVPSPRKHAATGEGTRPTDSSIDTAPSDASPGLPGLPGFRTWRGVYAFVLVVFAAVVIGLTIFSRVFA